MARARVLREWGGVEAQRPFVSFIVSNCPLEDWTEQEYLKIIKQTLN
ncbi:MAG: hypothetical protein MUE85_00205 [Microscillaceae bacterium]|nr:hypothetical protein [Microscillaceae bacterium]